MWKLPNHNTITSAFFFSIPTKLNRCLEFWLHVHVGAFPDKKSKVLQLNCYFTDNTEPRGPSYYSSFVKQKYSLEFPLKMKPFKNKLFYFQEFVIINNDSILLEKI